MNQTLGPHKFVFQFRATNGKGESLNESFSHFAPTLLDAVNMWVDHCLARGYTMFQIDYSQEETDHKD